jgi:hypothetical protein
VNNETDLDLTGIHVLRIAFFQLLSDIENYVRTLPDSDTPLASLSEMRDDLEKLVQKMDALEPGFDRIAERSSTCSYTAI